MVSALKSLFLDAIYYLMYMLISDILFAKKLIIAWSDIIKRIY